MMRTDDAGRAGVAPSPEFEERTFPYIHTHDDEDGVPLPPSAAENASESTAQQAPDDAEVQEQLVPWLLIVAEWARRP